jgi:hypothetical protein
LYLTVVSEDWDGEVNSEKRFSDANKMVEILMLGTAEEGKRPLLPRYPFNTQSAKILGGREEGKPLNKENTRLKAGFSASAIT